MDNFNLSGRFDLLVYTKDLAYICDFKSGFSEPDPAVINAQLKVLAVLVALYLPTVKEVICQIISGPHGVTETRYNRAQLAVAWDQIMATLKAINDPKAPFNPSPEACAFCPAINICQAVKELAVPMSRLQYSSLPLEPVRVARILDECELLGRHIEQIREFYSEYLKANSDYRIPGYGMEQGAPRRVVSDWLLARAKLEEFLDKAELDKLANFSIPAVEKLLGAKTGFKGSELKAKLGEILGPLLEAKYPAPSLKRLRGEPKIKTLAEA